jgi:hypothetical protein
MRAQDFLEHTHDEMPPAYEGHPLTSGKGLTSRDRYDVTHANLIIANLLDAPRASLGTAIEFGWADSARVPIIMVVTDFEDINAHAMLLEIASYIVPTVEEAVEIAKALLRCYA